MPRCVSLALVAIVAAGAAATARQPRQVSLIVTNGIVVTVNSARRVIEQGAVAVDGRDIVAVDTAPRIAAPNRR